jgi:hypothetical protein
MPTGERIGPWRLGTQIQAVAGWELWEATRDDETLREPRHAHVRRISDPKDAVGAKGIRREYETLRRVDDPRIPKALGYYAGAGALALERRGGPTLEALIEAAQRGLIELDLATSLDVALEVAHALRQVHGVLGDERIHHGHLKPDQISLDAQGAVTVHGLGARLLTPPIWRPPEGRPSMLGDQWQQARLLLELVSLAPLADLPQQLALLEPEAPALTRVLRKALATEPQDRYRVDREWLRALHEVARDLNRPGHRAELAQDLRQVLLDIQDPSELPVTDAAMETSGDARPLPETVDRSLLPETVDAHADLHDNVVTAPLPDNLVTAPLPDLSPAPELMPAPVAPPPVEPASPTEPAPAPSRGPSQLEWIGLGILTLGFLIASWLIWTWF